MTNGVFRGIVFAAPISLCLWGMVAVAIRALYGI